ncbi:MAG: penicillin-binding transpeptidase domain-containing protein, partial [Oscillospiraceae bacterium]
PTQSALSVTSELCNHSFGQGTLLATPLQVAEYTCCLANGGNLRPLSLVLSVGGEHQSENSANRVICEQAAVSIANCLKKAVQTGTGRNAQPSFCEAAGKTGTAQTGRVKPDGSEYVIGWFTGWFPADNPQYVITVMTEDAGYGFASAAPVFAAIANAMFESGCA